jgi:hypothetical protein
MIVYFNDSFGHGQTYSRKTGYGAYTTSVVSHKCCHFGDICYRPDPQSPFRISYNPRIHHSSCRRISCHQYQMTQMLDVSYIKILPIIHKLSTFNYQQYSRHLRPSEHYSTKTLKPLNVFGNGEKKSCACTISSSRVSKSFNSNSPKILAKQTYSSEHARLENHQLISNLPKAYSKMSHILMVQRSEGAM